MIKIDSIYHIHDNNNKLFLVGIQTDIFFNRQRHNLSTLDSLEVLDVSFKGSKSSQDLSSVGSFVNDGFTCVFDFISDTSWEVDDTNSHGGTFDCGHKRHTDEWLGSILESGTSQFSKSTEGW